MVRYLLAVVSFLTLSFGSSFWSEGKACWWEKSCQNKTADRKPKDEVEEKVRRILEEGDKYLNALSAKEVRELYGEVKELAVMKPTPENLDAYLKMTDFIRRKSLEFMYAYTAFVAKHPEYDVQSKVGTTSWSYRYLTSAKAKYALSWLKKRSDRTGLYFVCDASVPVCKEAAKAVQKLSKEGIPVVTVSLKCSKEFPNCVENPDAFKKLAKSLPGYYLFWKGKETKVVPIGWGLIPTDRLIWLLFRFAYKEETGRWIDPTQMKS